MNSEDKICCFLSWNLFLRLFIGLFLLGIPFGLYKFEQITIFQLISGIGAIIGFYLFYQRNRIFEKQLIQKDEQYHKDSKFKNFLEATKILTDENASAEAKISSMYLLSDVAVAYNDDSERIIQVINKQLTPLVKCIENNCEKNKYKIEPVKTIKTKNYLNKISNEFEYSHKKNKILEIDKNLLNTKQTIKEWAYKGNSAEMVISNALYILKKIVVNVLSTTNQHIDISNTILFAIDTDFDKNLKFKSKDKPTENLIFLHCKLENVDFSETKYHYCKFINCYLKNCNFTNSNLWGTKFVNCNFKDVKFKDSECEGVEFIDSINLTIEQMKSMKFQNIGKEFDGKKLNSLIIYNSENNQKNQLQENINCFTAEDEYKKWKNSF